jgi:hypothetical protein
MASDSDGVGIVGIIGGLFLLGWLMSIVAGAIVLVAGGAVIALVLGAACLYWIVKIIMNIFSGDREWYAAAGVGMGFAVATCIIVYFVAHSGLGMSFAHAIDASYGPPYYMGTPQGSSKLVGGLLALLTIGVYIIGVPVMLWALGSDEPEPATIAISSSLVLGYLLLLGIAFQYFLTAKGGSTPTLLHILTFGLL